MRLVLFLSAALLSQGARAGMPDIEVFKSAYCGCCSKWTEHLRESGFTVTEISTENVPAVRTQLGMPERYGSCHTAKVGHYVIEGHVPANDIKKMLRESPKAIGLAAPGMPQASPGMDIPNAEPFDVLLIDANGRDSVFSTFPKKTELEP